MIMAKELVSFMNASPTAFRAVYESKFGLKTAGFLQLSERETWKLELGGKYYFTRNHSTLLAFALGKRFEAGKGFRAIGAHTNSPRPKVKPVSKTTEEAKMSMGTLDDTSNQTQRLTITRPDDWHLHLRDGDVLPSVVPHSASTFGRAIIMPNLKPPVTTVAAARAYQERILSVLPSNSDFKPLMTLYLTDVTTKEEIKLAKESGVVFAMKLYPAGATTNSEAGVTDLFNKCMPVLEEMAEQGLPLLVHGEVADPNVDIFDRERVFIEAVLSPLVKRLPHLKKVMEHITTQDAVDFIESHSDALLAATVTPQHLLLNRNAIFKGGLQPHNYCLPVLKREKHRQALVAAVTSGSKRYFLGTDSAPHERHTKEASCGCAGIYSSPIALPLYAQVFEQAGALDKFEAFASFNGPLFYGLPRNTERVTLARVPCKIPTDYSFGSGIVVPLCAGETLEWSLEC